MTIRGLCGAGVLAVGVFGGVAAAAAQDKDLVEKGKQIYAAQKCSVCHSIEGKGAKKGPLEGVGSKYSEDEMRQWIVNAPEMTKKTKSTRKPFMKNYDKLPKGEVDALVAYMMSLKK